MSYSENINTMIRLLDKMKLQAERFRQFNDTIPQLEMDVLMRDVRLLYDQLLTMDRSNIPGDSKKEMPAEQSALENNIGQPVQAIRENEMSRRPENKTPAASESEDHSVEPGNASKLSGKRAKVIAANPPGSGNLFDEQASETMLPQTLHERIVQSRDELSLAEKLSVLPLQDLKKSIGINEKFKFINELFDGNLEAYNECINTLNAFSNYPEAELYIEQTMIPKFEWKKESGVFQSLLFLVQRKFNF